MFTPNELACIKQLVPEFSEPMLRKVLLSVINRIAAEKNWDINEIVPDPETAARAMEDFKAGRCLTTEEYIAEIRSRI